MNSLKKYPAMDVKAAVISGLTLCVWGAFIIGMQTYILVCYTQIFHDQLVTDAADQSWGDAYNGLALANAGACLLFGAFAAISIPERKTSLLILDMVVAVLGACGAAGSTVLAAIETEWLNVNVNTQSTHPCTEPNTGNGPTTLDCTNWIYLQVTVAVLSGLAFCSYTAIAVIVGLGLSSGRGHSSTQTMMSSNKSFYDDTASSNKTSSFSSPYQAYQPQPPMTQTNGITTNPDPYSDQHPQYSKHLQQLSIQQLAMEQEHKQAMMNNNNNNNNNKPPAAVAAAPNPVTRQAPPPPPSEVVQRGRLSVMYNQRGPAPPPPVPPKTYNKTNNNIYY